MRVVVIVFRVRGLALVRRPAPVKWRGDVGTLVCVWCVGWRLPVSSLQQQHACGARWELPSGLCVLCWRAVSFCSVYCARCDPSSVFVLFRPLCVHVRECVRVGLYVLYCNCRVGS